MNVPFGYNDNRIWGYGVIGSRIRLINLSAFEETQKVECRKFGEIFKMTIPSQA